MEQNERGDDRVIDKVQADSFDLLSIRIEKKKFQNCRLATLLERKKTRGSLHSFTREKGRFVNPDPKPQLPLRYVVRCRFRSDLQVQNYIFPWCRIGGLVVFKMRFGETT